MAPKKKQEEVMACPVCGRPLGFAERNAAIVREREQGATYEVIAQRYGLTRARIHAICANAEKWKALAK